MKKSFITFSGGDNKYHEAANRLKNQANRLNLFDECIAFSDTDLKNDSEFWMKHGEFIENNKRLYGYDIWKPYIIKKKMEQLNNGDILLYLDSGCEIDYRKKNLFILFFEIIKTKYLIATFICDDKSWCKMDLILKLDMLNDKYLSTYQHQAGAILFLVCDKTRNLVNMWYDLCCDYHNIDDTPSISPNFECFNEHRHDQSVFSLLTKKYDLYNNKEYDLNNIIEYVRNISGTSFFNFI